MKILVLDNYDSFVYNLVHYLGEMTDAQIDVFRNDEIALDDVDKYDKILLSPGPGVPDEAGILKPLIARYGQSKSIFGVCLGCQAIAEVFGGSLTNLDNVFHGVATPVSIIDREEFLFNDIPDSLQVGRYHSWVVNDSDLPETLSVTTRDEEGRIMGVRHKQFDVRGVQFHPESILTEHGKTMIKNWLDN